MKITFLGTGTSQGVPVIACDCDVCQSIDYRDQRLRTSILWEINETNIVVDTGPDFRQQMLRERVKQLDAVIFTHEHKDHTAGLDDVRSFNFAQKKDMPIYGDPRVIQQLKREFAYAFAEKKYPGVPQIEVHELDGDDFQIGDVEIVPIEVMHYKLPVYGYRIGDMAYITDANYISDSEKEKLKNLDVLIINALQKTEHISHYTLAQALDLIKEINPKRAYLTHLSHKMGLHGEVELELPDNVEIAYDGLTVSSNAS